MTCPRCGTQTDSWPCPNCGFPETTRSKNKHGMKKLATLIASVLMMFAFFPIGNVNAAEFPLTVTEVTAAGAEMLPPGVTQISSSNVLVGVPGTYENTSSEKLLKRINQIRQEAYNEGLASSYVPIKWSDSLEFISQIRSVEASVKQDHVRPKGGYVFVMTVNGVGSYAENLAWGGDALEAVEMWYSEKKDLVNHTGGETGHYESLIDPDYNYIGIGSFQGEDTWNTVAAEFTSDSGITENRTEIYGDCIQLIEVPKGDVTLKIKGSDTVAAGLSSQYTASAVYKGEDAYGGTMKSNVVPPEIVWTSSDESVAAVNDGKVTGVTPGEATITAKLGFYGNISDVAASKTIKVTEDPTPAAVVVKLTKGKKSFKAKWNDVGASGYQLQYSLDKKFKSGVKKKNVESKTSLNVKNLKSKKTYYVRVCAYNNCGGSTYYSDWSQVVKVKTK